MRKSLLMLAAAMFATCSFAQTSKSSKADLPMARANAGIVNTRLQAQEFNGTPFRAPQKTAATGLYYTKPAGAMYSNFNWDGMGYYPTFLYVQAWNPFTFVNMSTPKDGNTWSIDWTGIREGGEDIDVTENADENGDYTNYLDGGYYTLAPTLHNAAKTDAFALGYNTNDDYYANGMVVNNGYCTRVYACDTINTMGFLDDHTSNGYGFGSLDTGYLYGSGEFDYTDKETGEVDHRVAWGVRQQYPQPMSPLYVEAITTRFVSAYEEPIPGGEGLELKMYIINITDPENPVVEETLTANDESVIVWGSSTTQYTETGECYYGKMKFSNVKVDALGIEYDEPFVIDYPFMIQIEGVDQEGISVGFTCSEIPEEDAVDLAEPTYFLVTSENTGDSYRHYYSDCSINLNFIGMMDNCFVWTDVKYQDETEVGDFNVIKISDDGMTSYPVNDLSTEKLPGAVVETAASWYDNDDNEFYFIDGLPEWITGYQALIMDDYGNQCCIAFTAEPLPEGVESRTAEVRLVGRGFTAEDPIILVQGKVEDTAIEGVTADSKSNSNRTYNLAGQQINKNFKGIVVNSGKKMLVK